MQQAQADAAAAQQRVFEIRAEAALLVETVEDRAHEVRCLCCPAGRGACAASPGGRVRLGGFAWPLPLLTSNRGPPSTDPTLAAPPPPTAQAVTEAQGKAEAAEREVERLRAQLRALGSGSFEDK